jgi:hypothetical protein
MREVRGFGEHQREASAEHRAVRSGVLASDFAGEFQLFGREDRLMRRDKAHGRAPGIDP